MGKMKDCLGGVAVFVLSCLCPSEGHHTPPPSNPELLTTFPDIQNQQGAVDNGQWWILSSLKQDALHVSILDESLSESKQRFAQDLETFWLEMNGSKSQLAEHLDSLIITYMEGYETNLKKEYHILCHLSIIRSNVSSEIASKIVSTVEENRGSTQFRLCIDGVLCSEIVLNVIIRAMYTGQVRCNYFGHTHFDVSQLSENDTVFDSLCLSEEGKSKLNAWIRVLFETFAVYQHLKMRNQVIESFIFLQLDELIRHGYSQDIITQNQILGQSLFGTLISDVSITKGFDSLLSVDTPECNLFDQKESNGDLKLTLDVDDNEESCNIQVVLHKVVLMARSEYFRNMFLSQMSESSKLQVKLPLCQNYSVLKSYVFYLYHGYIHRNEIGEISVELLGIAKLMDDPHLISLCEEAIACRLDSTNIIDLYNIGKNMSLSGLLLRCEKMLVYFRETGEMNDIPEFDMNDIRERYYLSYRFQQTDCFLKDTGRSSLYVRCVVVIDNSYDFLKVLHSFLVRNCIDEDKEYVSGKYYTIRFLDSSGLKFLVSVAFDTALSDDTTAIQNFRGFQPGYLLFATSATGASTETVQQAIVSSQTIVPRYVAGMSSFTLLVGDRHHGQSDSQTPSSLANYCELGPIEESAEVIDRMFFSAIRVGLYNYMHDNIPLQYWRE